MKKLPIPKKTPEYTSSQYPRFFLANTFEGEFVSVAESGTFSRPTLTEARELAKQWMVNGDSVETIVRVDTDGQTAFAVMDEVEAMKMALAKVTGSEEGYVDYGSW